jgi:hypothetical protein
MIRTGLGTVMPGICSRERYLVKMASNSMTREWKNCFDASNAFSFLPPSGKHRAQVKDMRRQTDK